VSGIARGLYKEGDVVVSLLARKPAAMPDSILVVTVGQEEEDGSFGFLQAEGVSAGVMDALIELAVSIGVEGWEGRPVGALFVVGDSNTVMEKSRQLTLNPFQGYSEDEKNIMNPDVRHALHAFAVLDGAFIVREDGVVVAAGRYLNFDEEQELDVPLGLGARHMAAAGISRDSDAIAIVVSQTSGSVRVFRKGKAALELAPRMRRS
jgi:DNA integrity scanning protein DisA with diadenylate cyclase activity